MTRSLSRDQTPLLVGLFLFVGLVILGILLLRFGKFQRGDVSRYPLTASFADATGILEGSDVRLGGAKVGVVTGMPRLNPTFDRVLVDVAINEGIGVPRNAEITIAGAGMLGDKYIAIQVPENTDPNQVGFFKSGETLDGLSAGTLTSLQLKVESLSEKAENTLTDVQAGVVRITASIDEFEKMARSINTSVDKFHSGILSDANISDLRTSMEKLRKTSENLATASEKLPGVLDKGGKTLDHIDDSLAEIRGIFQELKPITEKVKSSVDRIGDAAESLDQGVDRITAGDGLLPALVNDRALRDDFSRLLANLRQRGVLFYRDRTPRAPKDPEANDGSEPPRKAPVAPQKSR